MKKTLLFITTLLLTAVTTSSARADTLVAARADAERGDYDAALTETDATLQTDPGNSDARLLKAQIHGWEKDYDTAQSEFDSLLEEDPANTDALLGRGYMYYAENELDAAERDFLTATSVNPTYGEAQEGLQMVQNARENPDAPPFLWQADVGGEYSLFARAPQTPWNNEFVQLTRQLPESASAVHVLIQRYDEFEKTDMYYEAGIDHRFTPYLNGYLYGGGTPDPGFRPIVHMASGGNLRLYDFSPQALWATLDLRYDDYPDTQVVNINPGLRYEFGNNWDISGTLITVEQTGDDVAFGWQTKLDGQIEEGWRFYTGVADAPETVAGSTVDTLTVFAGTAYDINPANTVNFAYTRDDRENSYIRHAIDVSLSHRF